jgi:hypothetical protein
VGPVKSVTVPPIHITYMGDLPTCDTSWVYETTGPQKIRTSSLINQWLWQVPFDNYGAGATTAIVGSNAINRFQLNGRLGGTRLTNTLSTIVRTVSLRPRAGRGRFP